mgnify:CR=1 FL=1
MNAMARFTRFVQLELIFLTEGWHVILTSIMSPVSAIIMSALSRCARSCRCSMRLWSEHHAPQGSYRLPPTLQSSCCNPSRFAAVPQNICQSCIASQLVCMSVDPPVYCIRQSECRKFKASACKTGPGSSWCSACKALPYSMRKLY